MWVKADGAAVKPLADELKAANDKLAAAETQVADLKASARKESPAPERKTANAMVLAAMSKAGLALPEGEDKLAVAQVDKALSAAGLGVQQRIMVKNELGRIGAIAA